jgi:acetamidase/formamidase
MSNFSTRLIFSLILFATVASDASAAEYTLMPSPQPVHIGYFSAAVKPVLTINSSDIVTIETASHIDPAKVDQSGVVPPNVVPDYTRAIFREVTDRGPAPLILTGPVAVNGAPPGDVLEVGILAIDERRSKLRGRGQDGSSYFRSSVDV